jgi:hypothetical protein
MTTRASEILVPDISRGNFKLKCPHTVEADIAGAGREVAF